MIIELPEKFVYTDRTSQIGAYSKDGKLYIDSHVNYEGLMYTIAYLQNGYDSCYYCGGKLTDETRTIDHKFPRCWGGVSVPPNLVPCCDRCNQQKANMTHPQYIRWKKYVSKNKKKTYYKEAIKKNQKIYSRGGLVLPQSWTREYDITDILSRIDSFNIAQKRFEKIVEHYDATHSYPRPIIVTADGWVLKGMSILYHAKLNNVTELEAIILENVEKMNQDV